jgi:hypothetical protein
MSEQVEMPGTESADPNAPKPFPPSTPEAGAEAEKGKSGRKKGQKNKPKTESPATADPLRQERKGPDEIKDVGSAIHATTERQRVLIARYRSEHPESEIGDAVDPFMAPPREPIPAEMIRPALDVIVGLATMLCKPRAEDVPTDGQIQKAAEAWSRASVYLPLPSPAAIAITGATFCTLGLVAPMAIARLQGIYASDLGGSMITGSGSDLPVDNLQPIHAPADPSFG